MSDREVFKLDMFDRSTPDYDLLNSIDDELIQIAAAPIKFFRYNLAKTQGDNFTVGDDLYGEADVVDEKALDAKNAGNVNIVNTDVITAGEIFDKPIEIKAFYQENNWSQELQRMGITEPIELAFTFNFQHMMSKLGKPIKIGDIIQTFRGQILRVVDAYSADESIGFRFFHFHVIAKQPEGLDNLVLPGVGSVPQDPTKIV